VKVEVKGERCKSEDAEVKEEKKIGEVTLEPWMVEGFPDKEEFLA
jgi:hypothetical protein